AAEHAVVSPQVARIPVKGSTGSSSSYGRCAPRDRQDVHTGGEAKVGRKETSHERNGGLQMNAAKWEGEAGIKTKRTGVKKYDERDTTWVCCCLAFRSRCAHLENW
ncbi:unnamed protein product, partial [Ectocarpus sp. 12 AP-2014]